MDYSTLADENAPGFENPFLDDDRLQGNQAASGSSSISSPAVGYSQDDGFRDPHFSPSNENPYLRSGGAIFGEDSETSGQGHDDHLGGGFGGGGSDVDDEHVHQRQQHHQQEQQHHQHTTHHEHHPGFRVQHQQKHEHQGQEQQQRRVPQYKLQAKVTGLERTGRKDPILRFDVHTNLPKFRTTQFRDVRRTHPEFVKLADHLISNNPECFVPAVPPPSTSAGVGTDEDEARVRGTMQRWLNYVCGNEVLMRDDEMVLFVESDYGYSPVVRKKQPATGVRRRVIKQFAPPPDDTPELADARPIVKAFYLGTMETGQKVDKVVKTRRGLGLAESDLGVKFHNLSTIEGHPGMANAFRKLGKTIQQVGDYHAAQATAEATTLGDPLQYHSSDAFIVKETLTNRQILQRELQQAQANMRSKESTAARLRAGSNIRKDKSDEAIAALDEARHIEEMLASKVRRVTANLVQERRKWFLHTSTDLRASIRDYVLRQIEAERRLLSTLESVRPDIRAIDSTGGLSRLGRDAPPASRRASVAASQGPRGDAWSGVQRAGGLNRSGVLEGGSIIPPVNGGADGSGHARSRSQGSKGGGSSLGGLEEVGEDDEDRLDAKNAASRLATSTF